MALGEADGPPWGQKRQTRVYNRTYRSLESSKDVFHFSPGTGEVSIEESRTLRLENFGSAREQAAATRLRFVEIDEPVN